MPLPTAKTKPKTLLSSLTILLYARSKFGKSTLAAQFPDAIFLATEAGLNHLEVFQQPINSWEELVTACGEIAAGKHNFKTVVIDTVDNAYRLCREYMLKKLGVDHESDLGFGKGFTAVNAEFHRVLTKLSMLPYGLVLISHAQEVEMETRTGKVTRIVPTLSAKARDVVTALVDCILYGDFAAQAKPEKGKEPPPAKRVLRTKPTMHYEAGDRTKRLPDTIGLDYDELASYFIGPPKVHASEKLPPIEAPAEAANEAADAKTAANGKAEAQMPPAFPKAGSDAKPAA